MKAHELAEFLLTMPNLPVWIPGYGSDEGITFEVSELRMEWQHDKIYLAYSEQEIDWINRVGKGK